MQITSTGATNTTHGFKIKPLVWSIVVLVPAVLVVLSLLSVVVVVTVCVG